MQRPRPFIVGAGMSERGMRFTIEEADAIFIGGRDDAELAATSRRAHAQAAGRRLRIYAMLILIIEDSDAEAEATVARFREGFDAEAFGNLMRFYGMIDVEAGRENAFTASARSAILAPHAAGSPATVTDRMSSLMETASLDGLMLIFPEYLDGLRRLGDEILPTLRCRFRT